MHEEIRAAIREALADKSMTAYELARRIGCPPNTIYVFLQGTRGISLGLLERIMAELRLEIRPMD